MFSVQLFCLFFATLATLDISQAQFDFDCEGPCPAHVIPGTLLLCGSTESVCKRFMTECYVGKMEHTYLGKNSSQSDIQSWIFLFVFHSPRSNTLMLTQVDAMATSKRWTSAVLALESRKMRIILRRTPSPVLLLSLLTLLITLKCIRELKQQLS